MINYDALGNVTKATDGNGNSVTYTYDIYGNQTGSNDGKYTTRTVYDYAKNNVTYYDENNKGKLYDYNAIGNLVLVKDVSTGSTIASYTYNNNDMMLESAMIGTKSKMTVEYNAINEVTARNWVDPNNSDTLMYKETYAYYRKDGYEEVRTKIGTSSDVENITRTDLDGYLIYTKENGIVTENTYDLLGNMVTTTTDGCTTKMEYDGLGRMTKMTKPEGNVYKYSYDTLGRKVSETAPNGGVTNYTYDDSNRLTLQSSPMTSNSQKSEKKYTYDNNGNVKTESIKTNLAGSSTATYRTTEYSYDARNNLIKV